MYIINWWNKENEMMFDNKKEYELFYFWSIDFKNIRCFRWYKCIVFKLVVNLFNKGKLINFSVEYIIGIVFLLIYCNFIIIVLKERKK